MKNKQLNLMSFWPQVSLDLKLWAYFITLFQLYRLFFIGMFSKQIGHSTTYFEIVQSIFQGLRFDSVWATSFVLVLFLTCTLPTVFVPKRFLNYIPRWRKIWFSLLTVISLMIFVTSYEYYKEYRDIFNEFLFGLIYDDTQAIFKTLIRQYHLIEYVLLLSALVFVLIKFLGVWVLKPFLLETVSYPKFFVLVLVFFWVAGFRGGLGPRPVQLKDAGVTKDAFLNKAVLPPFAALRYAIKEHRTIHSIEGLEQWLAGQDMQTILQYYFDKPVQKTIDDYMKKRSHGHSKARPRHIFLIVMESYDGWALLPEYAHLNISNELKALAKEGIFIPAFVSASNGTMSSLASIITGLPDAKILTNYQPNSKKPYPSSIAEHFKKLGYKTQVFYGGYLTWQRFGDFAKDQGFDVVYGAPHIANWLSTNEWGVDDASLFDFVHSTIAKEGDSEAPTFNLIMSTSNHPPFNIDLAKEGFDQEKMKEILKDYPEANATVKTLGHFWYADKILGQFVRKMNQEMPESVFAITGDHPSRRHVLFNLPPYDSSAVPLVLYGPRVLSNRKIREDRLVGGHLDIATTLLELAAPKDFLYYSMGRNLLAEDYSDKIPLAGFGNDYIMLPSCQVLSFAGKETLISSKLSEQLRNYYRAAGAIAWWRIVKGASLD